MITVEYREAIRRAYFVDDKSIRQIAKDLDCSRITVRRAIASAEPLSYTLRNPRARPVLEPFAKRIAELLTQSETNPRKQQFTAKRIFDLIAGEGFTLN